MPPRNKPKASRINVWDMSPNQKASRVPITRGDVPSVGSRSLIAPPRVPSLGAGPISRSRKPLLPSGRRTSRRGNSLALK